ncbi:receptor-like protein kinase FERONIA [Cornus florida]|uniref:receptor-like protein kinase FERONIA n=1 Tax=Cornus florida TaxID=4283 RepID=UPI002898052D|nr:receptor-like protein kinase FERONIA [Cornus florida]
MLTFTLYLFTVLLLTTIATTAAPYTPTFYVLLNCGSSTNTTDSNGRNWDGDVLSKFSLSNTSPNTSSPSTASHQDPSVPQVPFMTARIFHSPFTYTFPVTAGPKFLRLYFYPTTYSDLDLDPTQSFFSVTSNHYTLLNNFSAFLTVSSIKPPVASLIKEFILNFRDNQTLLNITFSPSPNSYAFINGIELLSMPDKLYMHGNDEAITRAGVDYPYYFDSSTVLETLYRLNVGGNTVSVNDDTGMFRTWELDDLYIIGGLGVSTRGNGPIHYGSATPAYTAPEMVYNTARLMGNLSLHYNLTWSFGVDSGFDYLVRLHFCDFTVDGTKINQRVFTIYLNSQTAEYKADVIFWSGGNSIPVYRDYVVRVPDVGGRRIKQDLWLEMHPNVEDKPELYDAILNGVELFKLNRSDGILAGPNPDLVVSETPEPKRKIPVTSTGKRSLLIGVIVGGVIGGIVAMSILGFLIFRRRQRVKDFSKSVTKSSWVPISVASRSTKSIKTVASLPSDLCRHFSLAEIKSATRNFDDNFVIGTGGFGNVYKGFIENDTVVAIKRLNPESSQGAHEFQTEIIMLSRLRHLHLVSLIGYCADDGEMILVYDYMAHGTLRDHLYKSNNAPLSWNQRLQIAIGAARGLHYLHTGVQQMIIHRDVKSTNILLDEKWVAKVSDFGLSKMGPVGMSKNHVSTVVKGSFGYVDPEYYRRQQLTDKSDVYSFGVVLLELLCARSPIIPSLPKEQVSLAQWGRYCYRKGTLDRIVDPSVWGQIAPECLKKFGEIANSCLHDLGIERPSMNDVVWGLEFALQLQETADRNINGGDGFGKMQVGGSLMSPVPLRYGEVTTTDDDDDVFSGSTEHVAGSKSSGVSSVTSAGQNVDKFKIENVFSELLNPNGR